jgi:hypothetical protein
VAGYRRHADPSMLLEWTSLDGTCISTVAARGSRPCQTVWGRLEFTRNPVEDVLALWEWDSEEEAVEGHADLVERLTDTYCQWWPPRDRWPADLPYLPPQASIGTFRVHPDDEEPK